MRHSERFDNAFPDKWRTRRRRRENPEDTPITKNGHALAREVGEELLKKYDIDRLYSSPMTRSVQTCGEIQKLIKKKTGQLLPIHIDYGLVEISIARPILSKTGFRQDDKRDYIDKKLSPAELKKRFPKLNLVFEKCKYGYKDVRKHPKTLLQAYNRTVNSVCALRKKKICKDKVVFACTHQYMISVYDQFLQKTERCDFKLKYCGFVAYQGDKREYFCRRKEKR